MNQQDFIHPPRELSESRVTTDASRISELEADLRAAMVRMQHEIETMRGALSAAGDRERLLAYELQHRVRNMLAVIRSIYRRSREVGANQSEFAQHFEGRLDAVARHHSHASSRSSGVDLEDMVRDELLQARCLDGPNCTISGPTILLGENSAVLMALAIHELVTNSIKFGALAQAGGLTVEWFHEAAAPEPLLHFRWSETGVSLVTSAPRPFGFGRQLIEEALPYQLGATTSFDLKPGGVVCSILLPMAPSPVEAAAQPLPSPSPIVERIR